MGFLPLYDIRADRNAVGSLRLEGDPMDQITDPEDRKELRELMLELLKMQEQMLRRLEQLEDAVRKKNG